METMEPESDDWSSGPATKVPEQKNLWRNQSIKAHWVIGRISIFERKSATRGGSLAAESDPVEVVGVDAGAGLDAKRGSRRAKAT